MGKIYRAFYYAGIMVDKNQPINASLRGLSLCFVAIGYSIHMIIIRIIYEIFNLKVPNWYIYGVLVIIAYYFWYHREQYYRKKLLTAKIESDKLNISQQRIRIFGIIMIICLILVPPILLLYIGVKFLNNYTHW